MFLNIEQYILSIKRKLEERNFNFNDNELLVLNQESSLKQSLFNIIIEEPYLFNKDFMQLFEKLNGYDEEILLNPNFLVPYCKCLIDDGDFSGVLEIRNYVDEELAQEIIDYFLQSIDEPKYIDSLYGVSASVIELAIDNGKYSFLEHIKRCDDMTNSLIEKLREYASTVERVPYFFAANQSQLKIDYSKYDVASLLKIISVWTGSNNYYESNHSSSEVNRDEMNKVYQVIYDKLMAGESFDVELFDQNVSLFFLNYNLEKKRALVELIIQQIGLTQNLFVYLSNDITQFKDLIIPNITPKLNIDHYYLSQSLLEDIDIVEKFIECGKIDLVISSAHFGDYVQRIIDKINSGDPNYQNVVIKNSEKLERYPQLLKLMLDKDMVNPIIFSSYVSQYDTELVDIILNEVRKGKTVSFPEQIYSIAGLLDEVVQLRNFETLLQTNLNYLSSPTLTEKSINVLIEELSNNISLADRLISSARNLIFHNKPLLNFYLKSNSYFVDKIVDRINHETDLEYLYNDEIYDLIKHYYAKKHKLNLEHLDMMEKSFGPLIIRYLDNDSLYNLVNLSDEHFGKFLALFSKEEFKLSDMTNIYDSLMQYKFTKEHPEIVNIFADIMHSLDDNNNIYIDKLEELYSVLNDKFYIKFSEVYPELVEKFKLDPKSFLLNITYQIKMSSQNKEQYTEILHFITNYYIANKREDYRNSANMYRDPSLNIPYVLDESDTEKKLIEYCLQYPNHKIHIIAKLVEYGISKEFAERCVLYFLSKKDKALTNTDVDVRILNGTKIVFSKEESRKIKGYLKTLNLVSKQYVQNMGYRYYTINQLDQAEQITRIYKVPTNNPDIFQLLLSINANALKHTLDNEEVYQSLLQVMHKYKLHKLPTDFKTLLESQYIEIAGDYSNLSGFISYYDKIYEAEKARLKSQNKDTTNISLKPVNIFIYAEVYSSVSSVYSQLLGSKDASLIKANSGPNSASRKTAGNERLNEAVERTISNFLRMSVTVPTFAENITLDNDKVMHVVVGNFTNPTNMTHGERTGACMRIGGVGESLFQFCLENENGFHIRFEDPVTGEYISRVSGFRNGNTVFLNELRHSCNSDTYSDTDVVDTCRKVAELLIEKSKNSECPIDNVVVHTAYAVDSQRYHKVDLGIPNIKVGLPSFYSDVSSTAHVLATSSTTSAFVPLDFDKSHVPTYLPAREKAVESNNLKKIIDMINRVSGVKAMLAGQTLESIEPVVVDDSFVYGIASQDWYIYIDENLEVHEDIIHIDSRAKEELETARKRIEEMLPIVEKQRAYSY